MMDNVSYLTPRDGQPVDELKAKARRARVDLGSSPPTRDQARELTLSLVSNWGDAPDTRLDSITEIWLHFPLPVCAACVHPWTGIAASKVKDLRSGALEPRRYIPSTPELRHWLNEFVADLHEIVRAGEIASRPVESPSMAENWPLPSPESVAHVQAKCRETVESLKRASGIPTAEEQRACAERILEAHTASS